MLPGDQPLTVPARMAKPYIHLDNRGLVVFDGQRCVSFPANMLGWVRETLGILLEEKRATRHRGGTFLGGMVDEDGVVATVYGGPGDNMITLEVSVEGLRELRAGLGG
jgi:hypothetical protein